MEIRVGSVWSRVLCTEDEARRLDQAFQVNHPRAVFIKRARPGFDGVFHFFKRPGNVFLTGLMGRVLKLFPKARIVDDRPRILQTAELTPDLLRGIKLRPDQIKAVASALALERGVIGAAVAAGKTEMALALWMTLRVPALYLVHRKDLLIQTVERFIERTGLDRHVSAVGDGRENWSAWSNNGMVVATVQSVSHKLEEEPRLLANVGLMILDEAHVVGSATVWAGLARKCPARFRIGLSGTPSTGDPIKDWTIEGTCGPVLYQITSADLAAKGVSVMPRVEFWYVPNTWAEPMSWTQARRELVEANTYRNELIYRACREEMERGHRVLVVCNTVRHVKILAEGSRQAGVPMAAAIGKHGSALRAGVIRGLRSGTHPVAVSTLFQEGSDVKELDTVVMAGSGKSQIRVLQRIGRALRKSPGKIAARIVDFFDDGQKHLIRHSNIRIAVCEREGFPVEVVDPKENLPGELSNSLTGARS